MNVGDLVKVKPSVKEPCFGWGTVTHDDVGYIINIESRGVDNRRLFSINFINNNSYDWNAYEDEVELVLEINHQNFLDSSLESKKSFIKEITQLLYSNHMFFQTVVIGIHKVKTKKT